MRDGRAFPCCALTRDFTACKRSSAFVVAHADGEHLTYCAQHARPWAHRARWPISEVAGGAAGVAPQQSLADPPNPSEVS